MASFFGLIFRYVIAAAPLKLHCFTRQHWRYENFPQPGSVKIVMDASIDLRGTFSLTLVPSHPKQERYEVVWRGSETYGAQVPGVNAPDQPRRRDAAAGSCSAGGRIPT